MNDERNWNDPQYKAWRLSVYRRDKFCCQMPGCKQKGFKAKIQAHHIKTWAAFPELRFQMTNGITLCKLCHQKIGTQEQSYEPLFMSIVSKKNNVSVSQKEQPKTSLMGKRLMYGSHDSENAE